MIKVYPKKNLGQHFLKDKRIAQRISASLTGEGYSSVLEIGPGMGILTEFIISRGFLDFRASRSELKDTLVKVLDNYAWSKNYGRTRTDKWKKADADL